MLSTNFGSKTLESMAYEISVLGQMKYFWKKPNILVETLDLPKSLMQNFYLQKKPLRQYIDL